MVFFFFFSPKTSTLRLTGNSELPCVAQADDTSQAAFLPAPHRPLGETRAKMERKCKIEQHKLALLAISNYFSLFFLFSCV